MEKLTREELTREELTREELTREELTREELKNSPFLINSNFNNLEKKFKELILSFNELKNNIKSNIDSKINLNLYAKLKLLTKNIDYINNKINDVRLNNSHDLSDEDIEEINCDIEVNDLLKKFLPLMILYKLNNT